MFREFYINLNEIEKVREFASGVNKFDSDVDMYLGKYCIDAKSELGIFSLDLSRTLRVVPHITDNEELERFTNFVKRYEVEI